MNQTIPCLYDLPLTGLDWLQYHAPHDVFHPAVDFNKGYGDQDCGNAVYTPRSGIVEYVNLVVSMGRGLGLFVIVNHQDGTYSQPCHLSTVTVQVGDKLTAGQQVGTVGKTGTQYCHCHFEVFGEKMAQIKRSHKYPWAFYPVGKSREWVAEHYINPWEWLKATMDIPMWAKSSAEKAKRKGVIRDWSNPSTHMNSEEVEFVFEKLGLIAPDKHEGGVSRSRMAVILDRLNLI